MFGDRLNQQVRTEADKEPSCNGDHVKRGRSAEEKVLTFLRPRPDEIPEARGQREAAPILDLLAIRAALEAQIANGATVPDGPCLESNLDGRRLEEASG